jgi:hypothetical protein
MSVRVFAAVFSAPIRPAARKLVALALANAARDDGTGVFPGETRLVRETGLAASSVRRHLHELRETDRIIVEVRKARTGVAHEHRFDLIRLARISERHEARTDERLSGERGAHPRAERRSSTSGEALTDERPNVLNPPQPSSKGRAPTDEEQPVDVDRVPSPWRHLPLALADSGLDHDVLHLLNAAASVTTERLDDADGEAIVRLVHRYGTSLAFAALSGIVAEHRDGNGGPIRDLVRLLGFAIKEETNR